MLGYASNCTFWPTSSGKNPIRGDFFADWFASGRISTDLIDFSACLKFFSVSFRAGTNYDIEVRIGRYHNIFGSESDWNNGREKVPAALCRKIAETDNGGEIEIWGDGEQTRSFLYIDECLEATLRLVRSDWAGPVNIGSEEMVSINQLAKMIMQIAGKTLRLRHIPGPLGVRGRCSDNRLYEKKLGWKVNAPLIEGLKKTYPWIEMQVNRLLRP